MQNQLAKYCDRRTLQLPISFQGTEETQGDRLLIAKLVGAAGTRHPERSHRVELGLGVDQV